MSAATGSWDPDHTVLDGLAAARASIFDTSPPADLLEATGLVVGAASTCWESLDGTGVFDDKRATALVDDLIAWVEANYVPREERP